MRPYQYRCNDHSLLTPPFKKWIISPLIRFVPWGIPANIITIISNSFIYFSLYVAIHPQFLGFYSHLCISVCFILYLIGDHLDGMQAKRTGTGSALGEFCDHYLDTFNNGILVFTMFTVFGIQNIPLLAAVIVVSYLAHMAVFYEQLKTGWLTFERVGSLEGVILSALMIGLSTIPSFYGLMVYQLIPGVSVAAVIIIASALGAVVTFLQTFKRTPDVKIGYWIFAALCVATGFLGSFVLNGFQLFTIITLYASFYIGRLMYGHLIDGNEYHADWLVPALLLVYFGMGFSDTNDIFWILTIYLIGRIIILIVTTFSALKMYWVWRNART